MEYTDLQKRYGAASRELRTLLLSVDLGTVDGAAIEKIKHKARVIVETLNMTAAGWSRVAVKQAYAKGEAKGRAKLEKYGKRPTGTMPVDAGPQPVVVDVLATLLKANRSITRTVDQYLAAFSMASAAIKGMPAIVRGVVNEFVYADFAGEIEDLARDAVKKELSRGQLQKLIFEKIKASINAEGFIAIIGKDLKERFYDPRKYAKMVARTTIREAQTKATKDLCRLYQNDLVEISSHGTDCPICLPFEGQIYSISGTSTKYPPLNGQDTPYHPNCQHSTLPISEEEIFVREHERAA